ncbi:PilN domain-containing protein [Pedobacter frigoris]|uniref:PilN domain-containing protein n=1 Tax=Pedobacter frigoris TaxID=2571272 RepID=UPI00145E57AD|nr:PilN domain-containing protein [Pedobacter frigoris]
MSLASGLTNCAGAEVHLAQDGTYVVKVVKISLDKQQVHIGSKKTHKGSLAKITPEPITVPLAITLTGRGILVKRTARIDVVSESSLQHLFPTLKLAEFYVQHFVSGAHSFVAIVRREVADAVMGAFKKQGAEVLMLSLGAFVVDQVIPQLNSYSEVLRFDGHQVEMNADKSWKEYNYQSGLTLGFPLKIDIETMPEEYLLAYATAFQLILNDKLPLIEVDADHIKDRLEEHAAKLKFKKYGTLMLFVFFALLMVNFLLLSMYNSSNQELMSKAGKQSYLFENRQKLEEEVKGKENLVNKLGWNKGYRYAYLCDQLASSLPKELTLHELQINPLSGNTIGLIKDTDLETGNMKIKGQTTSVYAVNNWIYELKQKAWVKDVQLEKYAADDQNEAQVFTILLNY